VFTEDNETRRVCREHNIPIVCVEHSDERLPRVDKMFDSMHNAQPDGVVGFVNSDIVVEDFDPMVQFIHLLNSDSGIFSNLEQRIPYDLYQPFVSSGHTNPDWFAVTSRKDVSKTGQISGHTQGGYDFWCWNSRPGGPRLLPGEIVIPPFRFPYAMYDNWILDMSIQSALRNTIDATAVLTLLHHEHTRVSESASWVDALAGGVNGVFINRFLGYKESLSSTGLGLNSASIKNSNNSHSDNSNIRILGKHYWKLGTPLECPYVVTCNSSLSTVQNSLGFALESRRYWSNVPQETVETEQCVREAIPTFVSISNHSNCARYNTILQETLKQEALMSHLPFEIHGWGHQSRFVKAAAATWRYTLGEQLKAHATQDKFVLLVGVGFELKAQLMNFICSLNRVGMSNHYVIAALDHPMYRWGVLQGLPMFLPSFVPMTINSVIDTSGYGGKFSIQRTKFKSRAVLEVLNAGYSVIWSDVDIAWFVHPFDALKPFMNPKSGLAIQSNAPYVASQDKLEKTSAEIKLRLAYLDAAKSIHMVENKFEKATAISTQITELQAQLHSLPPWSPIRPHETVQAVVTDSIAAVRRLNSGLYVAPNTPLVRAAFIEIVAHTNTNTTSMSERNDFDDVLCGRSPSTRSNSSCTYRPKLAQFRRTRNPALQVHLLNRFLFPSGAVLVGESDQNAFVLGKDRFQAATGFPLMAAHNNWIKGSGMKEKRCKAAGWWFIDDRLTCKFVSEKDDNDESRDRFSATSVPATTSSLAAAGTPAAVSNTSRIRKEQENASMNAQRASER